MPLHGQVDIQRIIDEMTPDERAVFYSFYECFLPPYLSTVPRTGPSRIDMTDDEVGAYLKAGIFKKVPTSYVAKGLCLHLFFTPMFAEHTKRLITHIIDINNHSAGKCPTTTFDAFDVRLVEGTLGVGWVADLMSWYHQLPTPRCSEPFYSFMHKKFGALCLASWATGQRQTVGAAQSISMFLARKTTQLLRLALPRQLASRGSLSTVYIDNFRRREQDRPTAVLSAKAFLHVAARYNTTVNESLEELVGSIGQPYDFLGVHYDGSFISLSSKMRDKLQALLTECSSSDLIAQWTMQDFASIMGILVNANTVVAACPSKYYYVYKFMRRRAQQQLPDNALVRVWPSTVPIERVVI